MKIFVRNIVHRRTRNFVIRELKKHGLNYITAETGVIEVDDDLPLNEICRLNDSLRKNGLDVVFVRSNMADRIRHAVLNLIKNEVTLRTSISFYISDLFSIDFIYLNDYFKKETGLSIEEYYRHKQESPENASLLNHEVSDRFWHLRWWNFN